MRFCYNFFFLFVLCSVNAHAQPAWSPELRAENEVKWMKDSLKLSVIQLKKIHYISLKYNRSRDSINISENKKKEQIKQQLDRKKDAEIKSLISKEQYQKYFKREQEMRKIEARQIKGRPKPY